MVVEDEITVAVFFGPEEHLLRGGKYTHLVEVVALDRTRNLE